MDRVLSILLLIIFRLKDLILYGSRNGAVGSAEDCSRVFQMSLGRWFKSGFRDYNIL